MSNKDIKDYYYILGLARNASKEEIKMAYRKLSVKFHPDKNNGDQFFEERFKDIQEAYETLEDDIKRKIYDVELNKNNSATYSTSPGTTTPNPPPSKKRSKDIIFAILGILLFLSPFIIQAVIKKLKQKDNSETYNLLRYDTTNHRLIDAPGSTITIHDTTRLPSSESSGTGGPGSLNTNSSNENTETSNFKDDDGLSAEDAVRYFLNALNNSDCTTAWSMVYNASWANAGKDWFCSGEAFGTVKKLSVKNIYTVSQYRTVADIYADYYAEDPYNGNKCFKQNIRVQKIEYTDSKLRWKITKMTNVETPVECYGN